MSAVAMGLLKKGYSISGSDLVKNSETNKLEKLGAYIFNSQIGQNIEFITSKFNDKLINIVVSTAIKPENKELIYCKIFFSTVHQFFICWLDSCAYYKINQFVVKF